MKKTLNFLFVFLAIVLTSCSAVGTKTLYRSDLYLTKPAKIGFSQIASVDIIEQIVKGSAVIYDSTMVLQLTQENILSDKIIIENFNGFGNVTESQINKICTENQLDGLILTQLRFLNVRYSTMFIPIGVSEDTEVEMQYYDAKGNLLLHTKHNTNLGNSYFNFPTAERTVSDGTKGALSRIIKEIEKQ